MATMGNPSGRSPMDRDTIKKSHAKKISGALFPGMNYLYRLRERMQKVGFPHNDQLYLLVCKAYDAMHHLSVEAHCLSCDGVGNPLKKEDSEKSAVAKPIDTS
jgi:hypothetical protein